MNKYRTTISIDPGDHIGLICHFQFDDTYYGATISGKNRLMDLWNFLNKYKPDVIVYEVFALRAINAKKLVGNKFVTCEVIGVIKLWCSLNNCKIIPVQPIVKEYCGFSSNPKDEHYNNISMFNEKITEHTRDAYRIIRYYKLFLEEII